MARGQFHDPLKVDAGTLSVAGPLDPDELRPREGRPQHLFWVVAQDDQVSAGLVALPLGGATEWRSQESEPHAWTAGVATATAVILTVNPNPTAADPNGTVVETFAWTQRVTLELS